MVAIPRSGSCRSDDPEYDPLLVRVGTRLEFLLDGQPVDHVIAYDCDHGWIRRLKVRHGSGKPRPYVENGCAAEQVLRGKVEVRWR